MPIPGLAGALGAYPVTKKLATGDNVFTLSDYGLAYDATTNPRGIADEDDYIVWHETYSTAGGSLVSLGIKTDGGVISKSGTAFTLVADADLNDVSVTVWVIPQGGHMRTVL